MPSPLYEYIKMIFTGTFPEGAVEEITADGVAIWQSTELHSGGPASAITLVDVPSYVSLTPAVGWKCKGANRYPGFRIQLDGLTTLEEYLKGQFGKGRQSSFKLYRKRLERSFDVRYVVYHGDIAASEYEQLFDSLLEMIRTRFREKETNNEDWDNFPLYRQYLLEEIRRGRANCQVIYDGSHPVYISFNVISGKGVVGLVNGFDTDYYKFHPGFTGILHLVEWAIATGYHFVDLQKGDLAYKRLFSNDVYTYQTILLYPVKSKYAALKARLKTGKLKFLQQLLNTGKKLGIRDLYHQFRQWRYRRIRGAFQADSAELVFAPYSGTELSLTPNLAPLEAPHGTVKRALYSYLYHSGEHRTKIRLYQHKDTLEVVLVGSKGIARILNPNTPLAANE